MVSRAFAPGASRNTTSLNAPSTSNARPERFAPHPQHTEALRLRQHCARRDRKHELRTARDANDFEHAITAVDQRAQLHARREQIGFGECLVDEHFVVAGRIGPAACT